MSELAHPSSGTARHESAHPPHESHAREYVIVFIILMALLALTIGVAYMTEYLRLGLLGTSISYFIAAVKAALVIMYFMHVKRGAKLTWIFSTAAFVWLGVLLVLTMGDYLFRTAGSSRRAEPLGHIVTTDNAKGPIIRP